GRAGRQRRRAPPGGRRPVTPAGPNIRAGAVAAVGGAGGGETPGVLGIHLEGPFLDPARTGAHDARHIRQIGESDIAALESADCGVLMLTLAPNRVAPAVVSRLARAGILVSLGHSAATGDEAQAALAAGARAFTHLFNAMSHMEPRKPGMVGAALADLESYCGIIADGHHVDDTSLRVALAAKPRERIMLVTDAMPTAAGGPDSFD